MYCGQVPSFFASNCSSRLQTPDALFNSFTIILPDPPAPPEPPVAGAKFPAAPPPPPPVLADPASPLSFG